VKIEGVPNTVAGNIFSGYYLKRHNRGIRPKLFEFSSPSFSYLNFDQPYEAKLLASGALVAAGRKIRDSSTTPESDRSGALYYYDRADLYGVCHGFGHDIKTFHSGYNFYNAFYPAGYFTPPFGENLSIFKANLDGYANLDNGACAPLSVTDYNEEFGIVSRAAEDVGITTATLTANIYSPIYSPKEVCPPDVAITNYFDEVNFTSIPGTTQALGASDRNNNNPVPTSLDNFAIKVNGRYQLTSDNDNNFIQFSGGKPIPSYSFNDQENKLNNVLCLANLMETETSFGRGTNGIQLVEAPDILFGGIGDQVSFAGADPWHYWHFTFRENAATLPFFNDFTPIRGPGVTHRSISEGTQLFIPILSSEDSYWQNRQCPDTVDFLPHTFGASIYACPSEHFDIPYYSAIKKFGFYGTRFLNSCKKLLLVYPWSGVQNATELPEGAGPYTIDKDTTEPDGLDEVDGEGRWSFSDYDNLLRTAKAEEKYSNMYAFNKGFFIWANSGYIGLQDEFSRLQNYNGFSASYNALLQKFQKIFTGGLTSFTGSEPMVMIVSGLAATDAIVVDSGNSSELLFTNDTYISFRHAINNIVTGTGINNWISLEDRFAYYVSDGNSINESFYSSVVSGREKRMATRYFENLIRGNAIDLYPLNHIPFSFDKSNDYLSSSGWGRSPHAFGKSSTLPAIDRRYFEGAYGNSSAVTGLADILNALALTQDTFYYPGFFNDIRFGKTIPKPTYEVTLSGLILDTAGRSFAPSGWLAIGYNEVGALDSNFSCFTPIFTQSPLPKVFCKIGQAPTLRSYAVDYHSLPEDKMSQKYPEIAYWCEKLKLFSPNKTNLYPLKYKWHRVLKTDYDSFLSSGDFNKANAANPTGEWCCMEGDGKNCTVIHPLECFPTGLGTVDSYTFVKGAKKNNDDQYYYFCLASGRFGVRMSNKSELVIEDWVRFDVSFKNAMNAGNGLRVDFEVYDKNDALKIVSFDADTDSPAYDGYELDVNAIPEAVVEQKIPPPNAGFGAVTAYRFIGPVGYVGGTRSYAPSTLKDTRGLREVWGHLLDYGSLIKFSKSLSQAEGDLLYGYKHIPTCENFAMPAGKKGIKVMAYCGGYKLSHWSLYQKAFAAQDSRFGAKWQSLVQVDELYPPTPYTSDIDNPRFAVGQYQWGNNLGAIKRFGQSSNNKSEDIVFLGGTSPNGNVSDDLINQVKKKVLSGNTLAGINCGYSAYGVGRNMLYYIEAFERFYILCDLIKKKNVQNISFLCPGLRQTNSATQYFWLGKPSNTYVERRPMYGPYAYQWRVRRHNRDRNGNGVSEAFYSPALSRRYEMLYDAPAIYGLMVRQQANSAYANLVSEVQTKRATAVPNADFTTYRNIWFGKGNPEEGTFAPYGNIFFTCDDTRAGYSATLCDYVETAGQLAGSPDTASYGCPTKALNDGNCFDPCMSLRYAQGFFPGGKAQDLFSFQPSDSFNLGPKKNLRLMPVANYKGNSINVADEQSLLEPTTYFRPPINTPHARIHRGLQRIGNSFVGQTETIVGVSACQDGGADHCNYLTSTIHLGAGNMSSILRGDTTSFNEAQNFASNIYSAVNIRGESN
jgi:hypothetical protein